MAVQTNRATSEADHLPEIERSEPPITQLGDLWQLGPHYLLCGDALKAVSYERLLKGKLAQIAHRYALNRQTPASRLNNLIRNHS
jgi:hypothetical protein